MSDDPNQRTGIDDKIMDEIMEALAGFPLPDRKLTSDENYLRILDWLHSGDVGALIIGLSFGLRKKAELEDAHDNPRNN